MVGGVESSGKYSAVGRESEGGRLPGFCQLPGTEKVEEVITLHNRRHLLYRARFFWVFLGRVL